MDGSLISGYVQSGRLGQCHITLALLNLKYHNPPHKMIINIWFKNLIINTKFYLY
jgi:hypothetical protein